MTVNISKPALNIAAKLAELNKPSGIAGEAILRAETPQEQFNLIGAGRKNILINGGFNVSQRGDYTSATTLTTGTYWVDRWYADFGTVSTTYQQTDVDLDALPVKTKAVKVVATSNANGYMGIRQKIENPTDYVGRTFTYSAWVRSNHTSARLTCYMQGSPSQVVTSATHPGDNTWQLLSVTFPMTGNPTTAWYVDVFVSNSNIGNVYIETGNYLEVTGAQLEVNTCRTPFELRTYGEELALCQRFFSIPVNNIDEDGNSNVMSAIGVGRGAAGGAVVVYALHSPVPMRDRPAITSSGNYYITDGTSRVSAAPTAVTISQFSPNSTIMLANYSFASVVCDDDRVNMVGAATAVKITLNAEL